MSDKYTLIAAEYAANMAAPAADAPTLTLVFHEAWLLSGAPKGKNAPELG